MEENKTYSMSFTLDELVILSGAVATVHKEAAKNFYESLAGLKVKEEELSIDEFDSAHTLIMGLYDKFTETIKKACEEEKEC